MKSLLAALLEYYSRKPVTEPTQRSIHACLQLIQLEAGPERLALDPPLPFPLLFDAVAGFQHQCCTSGKVDANAFSDVVVMLHQIETLRRAFVERLLLVGDQGGTALDQRHRDLERLYEVVVLGLKRVVFFQRVEHHTFDTLKWLAILNRLFPLTPLSERPSYLPSNVTSVEALTPLARHGLSPYFRTKYVPSPRTSLVEFVFHVDQLLTGNTTDSNETDLPLPNRIHNAMNSLVKYASDQLPLTTVMEHLAEYLRSAEIQVLRGYKLLQEQAPTLPEDSPLRLAVGISPTTTVFNRILEYSSRKTTSDTT
ncbi:hypothetical protein IWQ61_004521 [Dispira simplex]|nr:hypothetical protein IWQ61_004521 [Dispira simplex]